MVHNHWSVSCGVEVLSFTYSWSRRNGGDHWDRGSHPGGDCAYGSGACDGSGTTSSICWVRWDDARYDGQDCPARRRQSQSGLSAPARRSRGQQRARARLLHPRAGRRCTPRSRAPPMPRRRRRPFYSMGFARSAGTLDIICAAGEASGSGVWRRLTRGRAQACVAWRRRAGAGREYRGAPGSARCLRAPSWLREQTVAIVAFPPHGPTS